MVEERLKPEGEQDVVALPGIVRGGEVQSDPDDRMDVLHAGGLIVVVRRSSGTAGSVDKGGSIRAAVA
jgi:hypothetical protein